MGTTAGRSIAPVGERRRTGRAWPELARQTPHRRLSAQVGVVATHRAAVMTESHRADASWFDMLFTRDAARETTASRTTHTGSRTHRQRQSRGELGPIGNADKGDRG